MTPTLRSDRAFELLECVMCAADPVVVTAQYIPKRLTAAGKQRIFTYALCADCYAEVQDERTQGAAVAAIERYFDREIETTRPPWERRS